MGCDPAVAFPNLGAGIFRPSGPVGCGSLDLNDDVLIGLAGGGGAVFPCGGVFADDIRTTLSAKNSRYDEIGLGNF